MKFKTLTIRLPAAASRQTILQYLTRRGIALPASCAGQGICGLCQVKISGVSAKIMEADRKKISPQKIKVGYRLACQHRASGTVSVFLPAATTLRPPAKQEIGLALDLGTTIIKGLCLDLKTGETIGRQSIFNPQVSLGGDVMMRISEAQNGKKKQLADLLRQGVHRLQCNLGLSHAVKTAVVGNPVMLSFYLNRSLTGFTRHPYESTIHESSIIKRGRQIIFPVIGGFVGADTLAGLYALGDAHAINRLYLDLGTNGEVAIARPDQIWTASTAAGPAFEGAGIKHGMLAVPGAIDRIVYNNRFLYWTINRRPALGFCASGLIDLLATGLDAGYISENGRLNKPMQIAGFSVDQNDIRILQLAVAALHTGIKLLLDKSGLTPDKLDEAVITGDFGQHLNTKAVIRIGLIPKGIKRIRLMPDLPLAGAIKALLEPGVALKIRRLKSVCRHLDLARQNTFQASFVTALALKPWP